MHKKTGVSSDTPNPRGKKKKKRKSTHHAQPRQGAGHAPHVPACACSTNAELRTENAPQAPSQARKVRALRAPAHACYQQAELRTENAPQPPSQARKVRALRAPAHACYQQAELRTENAPQAQAPTARSSRGYARQLSRSAEAGRTGGGSFRRRECRRGTTSSRYSRTTP